MILEVLANFFLNYWIPIKVFNIIFFLSNNLSATNKMKMKIQYKIYTHNYYSTEHYAH